MIGVIVPVHNEEEHLSACLNALLQASCAPSLSSEAVVVVVVLDSCSDSSATIARQYGVVTVEAQARSVGAARALGAAKAIDLGARWLATTDADTVVAPDWLAVQLSLCSDAVCGTVAVSDWGTYGEQMRQHYDATYTDADGHRHIHGANFGVSTAAYLKAGGFPCLATSEDVALVEALQAQGSSIAWSAAPRVVTSARRTFRAPQGFGATLLRVELESQRGGAENDA